MCYIPVLAKDFQINIRFDEATSAELTATSKALGVSKSQLVRHLTKTFLQDVKRNGALKLSLEWTRLLGVADARSEWGERKLPENPAMLNEGDPDAPMPGQDSVNYRKPGKRKAG